MSILSAFTLAEAVMVTVSAVVGVAGVWDVVSDMLPLVVVVFGAGEGPGVGEGTLKDLAPAAGSVFTANELLALA
mgnify:CR=1 FL=1